MFGLFPPNSNVTFFKLVFPAACCIKWPIYHKINQVKKTGKVAYQSPKEISVFDNVTKNLKTHKSLC